MRRKLSLLLLLASASTVFSQLPDTDLWLFELKKNKQGVLVAKDGRNITGRPGYDNQPSFSTDGKRLFYSSVREDGQADIYVYRTGKRKTERITSTVESEYSPALTPDGKQLSCVVVEKDSAQIIRQISIENSSLLKQPDVDSVGYYVFLNADTVVYYKLSQPHSLRYHVMSSGEDRWICDHPGRTLQAINRSTLLFGIKAAGKVRYYKYDFLLRKAVEYTEDPQPENVFFHSNFGLIKAEGAKLFSYSEKEKNWTLLFDLSGHGLRNITRFVIDKKARYLVAVNNP